MVRNTSCLPVYTTITCQTISPGGDFYAASSDDGDVCVWKVDHLLADLSNKPIRSWRAADGSPVYSLTSTDRYVGITDHRITENIIKMFTIYGILKMIYTK